MPPEPLPWDRKERKQQQQQHERSELLVGGGGSRWREPPPHHHYGGSSRWPPDFRPRGGPPGHGKLGGWYTFPEESGHVCRSSNNKIVEDESCRRDGVKYGRHSSSKENRSFGQRDRRGSLSASPSTPVRQLNDASNDQTSAQVMVPHNSEYVNTWDQTHSREQHDKSASVNGAVSSGQRFERENSLGSIEWRPLKWTRSGSLSSRGSLSQSGSSKSMGVDSNETKPDLQQPGNSKPVQSLTGDATACVTSAALFEETTSRKKRRLGWGEGLAKYEKKKVDGPEDSNVKLGDSISGDSVEPGHSHPLNPADKSPRVAVFLDCPSPATPSSVACSSSPGLEDKQLVRVRNVDHDAGNLGGSPSIMSQCRSDGLAFNLENLDLARISNLNLAINELLQLEDASSVDSGYIRSTAVNRLLVWKSDISKALEKTEAEIDSLENELKTLISVPEDTQLVPYASCSPPKECNSNSHEHQGTASNIALGAPALLQVIIPEDVIGEKGANTQEDELTEVKVEDIDSPGSATSKFVELPSGKDMPPVDAMKRGGILISYGSSSRSLNVKVCSLTEEKVESGSSDVKTCSSTEEKVRDTLACSESSQPPASYSLSLSNSSLNFGEDALYNLILAANKDTAHRAFEVFKNLLPSGKCSFDFSRAISVSLQIDPAVEGRFARRKQVQQFKEKIIALKFRIYQHLWKEDIHLLSVKKFRAKSQKKFDLSPRPVHIGHQKHRSTVRSRFSAAVGNLSLVSSETLNFASRILSNPRVKVCRNMLRMPALILDQKERTMSRFISKNSLVEDPSAVEKERSSINPWTTEERETFIHKLAIFGKDFRKIASFLDHKTTADCVEFYYKNHKSECFQRTKRKPDYSKQAKVCSANTYLVASSGKRWSREANSVSLDILGAASAAIAANVEDRIEIQRKGTLSKYNVRMVTEYKTSRHSEFERSHSPGVCHSERETVAADVLAGICGSLSSEAISSCITSSVDPGEGNQEWKHHQKVGSSLARLPLTPEVTQSVDDETCSDESCGEMVPTDWTDEEKSIFIQAMSAYGKDFAMVSKCVRTRSRDQCKIFFSKARKCLGLDKILSGPSNLVKRDDNDGSDPDGCAVETELLCNEKSSLKLEEVSDLCVKGGISKPDMTKSDDKDEPGELDSVDIELVSKNPDRVNCQLDKLEVELRSDSGIQTRACIGNGVGDENAVTTTQEGVQIDVPCVKKVSAKHLGEEIKEVAEHGLKNETAEIAEVSRLNCSLEDTKRKSNSLVAAATGGESCLDGSQDMTLLESDSECKSDVNYLESNISVQRKPMAQASNAADNLSELELENIGGDKQCENATELAEQLLSSTSHLGPVGYSLGESDGRQITDLGCSTSAALQEIQVVDRNLQHSDTFSTSGCFLQKCNGTNRGASISNQEQTGGGCSSDAEKPCRNGDVKLFGQILSKPCPRQNPSSNEQHSDGSIQQLKVFSNSFNASHNSLDGNLVTSKFEHNNFLYSENHPVRSYGFWDGNRIQTGFSSLPDSAILLAKYPAAFGNYAISSTKMEQPPLQGVVKNERNLNGVPVFPTRDVASSNSGVAAATDYQVYRGRDVQPFTIEMKQRQDVLSEMQRRNGFEMQQQARGVVVGRGGILVGGGQCSGIVSDPVAAIKRHYAKAEQASIISREDDSWRSKGDISR